MNYYRTEKVNDRITAIRSLSGEIMYLVEGTEKAALIDTCLGVGHLKDFVLGLTEKPLIVLLTHGHIDHALGAPEFDEVYMNDKDIELYKSMAPLPERQGYIRANIGEEAYAQIRDEDYVQPMYDKVFLPLEDGAEFDLGGVHVETVAFPGHTQGSMSFLIREERILVTGDCCNNSTFLFGAETSSVKDYKAAALTVIKKMSGKFDKIFLSHHQMEEKTELLENIVELCDEIMAGTTDDVPFEFMGMHACIAKKCTPQFGREDGKCGNIIYRKDHIC